MVSGILILDHSRIHLKSLDLTKNNKLVIMFNLLCTNLQQGRFRNSAKEVDGIVIVTRTLVRPPTRYELPDGRVVYQA